MRRHPLDPIALVAGVITLVAGVVAVLHQAGAISLGPAPVVLLGLVVLGLGGAALVAAPAAPRPVTQDTARKRACSC